MARICARCRQPAVKGDGHLCMDDDGLDQADAQDGSDEEGEAA